MKSLNIVFTNPKEVRVVEESVGSPAETQVLCKTEKSLVSIGTELTCLNGVFDEGTNWKAWVQYPFNTGYSIAARVVEVGSAVKQFKVGDRVGSAYTHNQYFLSGERDLMHIPDGVSMEDTTWIALERVAQNIIRKCQIQLGDTVAVIGQGQVGQLVTQFARIAGAGKIIAIDPLEMRAEMSEKSGATHVLSCTVEQSVDQVKEITGGDMVDIAIDSTGHPKVLSQASAICRRYGKIGLVGDCSVPSQQTLGSGVVSNSLTILGMHGTMVAPSPNAFYPWTMDKTNLVSMEYMLQKRLNPGHLVTHVFSPQEAEHVYMDILKDRASYVGVIFDWTT